MLVVGFELVTCSQFTRLPKQYACLFSETCAWEGLTIIEKGETTSWIATWNYKLLRSENLTCAWERLKTKDKRETISWIAMWDYKLICIENLAHSWIITFLMKKKTCAWEALTIKEKGETTSWIAMWETINYYAENWSACSKRDNT